MNELFIMYSACCEDRGLVQLGGVSVAPGKSKAR